MQPLDNTSLICDNMVNEMETALIPTMESSSRGSLEGGLWTNSASRVRRSSTSSLQLQSMLMFITFTSSLFPLALSKRNESITSLGTIGPWNKSLYKTERHCLDFHEADASSYFYYWPEDEFEHCCSSVSGSTFQLPFNGTSLTLGNFTYGAYGPPLLNGHYADLGLIDKCLPYWNIRCLLERIYRQEVYMMACEYRDLRRFFRRRFWTGTVLNYGLLQSALPFIFFLEVLVMPFGALYWLIWGRPGLAKHLLSKTTFRDWYRVMRSTLLMDWVHLLLLAVIGNGLLEAAGRQNPYHPQSESFYIYSMLYAALTSFVWVASFLQQLSYLVSVIEDRCELYDVLPTSLVENSHLTRQTSESMKLKVKMGLNMDWKLQPIGAQTGILFCLWAFLTNVGSKADVFFGLVVAAAAPWSGLYALNVIGSCVHFLVKLRLSIAQKRRHQRMRPLWRWRRVLHLAKWRSNVSEEAEIPLRDIAQSEDALSNP